MYFLCWGVVKHSFVRSFPFSGAVYVNYTFNVNVFKTFSISNYTIYFTLVLFIALYNAECNLYISIFKIK